ncbi:MAG: T9SS type A sorting domain-containing protein [Saprospiraceae bacterium]|nr:T9SS type A sorting domain-containing protein [Saprospiraceae bacterium]
MQFILLAELIGNDMHLELSDESGKIVLSQALTSHISKLDIQKLNAGYYSVRLYQNQRLMQTEKLVVTR